LTTARRGFAAAAGLYVSARVVSMTVGLATIPVLVHSLGGEGFAAWALLLSCSVVFSELHLGVYPALMRAIAAADHSGEQGVSRLWASALGALATLYLAAFPAVLAGSRPVAEWLRLPMIGVWHPGAAVVFVFAAVFLRSLLTTGALVLFASALFRKTAGLSVAQSVLTNASAAAAAWLTRDLRVTLVVFWSAHLAVEGAGFVWALSMGWRPRLRLVSVDVIRKLLAYGMRVQLSEWAQMVNFQFDKFVIARVLGLWPAALYEVSNRSVLALRSIPSSSMDTFLPIVARGRTEGADVVTDARKMAFLALYAILLFFAAPLAVAPLFLFAWVGEMGYVARHVFAFLIVGAGANLLAQPLAALAQAKGDPRAQAQAAGTAILLNVLLSLMLVRVWGLEGAALGSSIAMLFGSMVLFRRARHAVGDHVVTAVTDILQKHWSLFLCCVVWGVTTHLAFGWWIEVTSVTVRYELSNRLMAAGATAILYGACVATLLLLKLRMHGLSPEEEQLLGRIPLRFRETASSAFRHVYPRGRSDGSSGQGR
jgi:O-antigen/teichoic acid export membrane protein